MLSPDTVAGWRARQALRQRFSEALPPRVLIDLTAVVTELINNAVAHRPQRPITIALAIDGDSIRGEVADHGNLAATIPPEGEAADDDLLGLRVVDQLTSRWGVYAGSSHVWFELPLET